MGFMKTKILSSSPRETQRLGASLARIALKRRTTTPFIIALHGELGSGKTTFIQGLARELGIRHPITSPTFLIVRHYITHRGRIEHFFHIDAYRIKNRKEIGAIGLRDIFSSPRSIIGIEWPERLHTPLPRGTVRVQFYHGPHEHERIIKTSLDSL